MISIIAPVYNEVDNLILLHERVFAAMSSIGQEWELILVNDGSHDGSTEVLNQLAAEHPTVKVVHFKRNFGQTAAMMAGIDYARGDIIIPIDADLQNDPNDIPLLLDKLAEGYDVCSGWRRNRQDDALRRNLPSRMANWLISKISGVHLHDYGCSLKAYRRDVIKGVKLYGEMHRFIPIYASWHGARVAEIPVNHYARQFGQSKYGLERIIKVILDLAVVKFLDHYAQKPMYIFGGFGVVNFAIAILAGFWALYLKGFEHTSLTQTPLPLLVVMASITGFMCILMGLLAELVTRTYHESQNKSVYLVKATRNLQGPSLSTTDRMD